MTDLTPQQTALIDAVRDIATYPEAPGAKDATAALIRLLDIAFGAPRPVREGGLVGMLFGNPVQDGMANIFEAETADEKPTPEPWPFKPGDVVRAPDDGAAEKLLDRAPVGTVLRDRNLSLWTRTQHGWGGQSSAWVVRYRPLTVVSVPGGEN